MPPSKEESVLHGSLWMISGQGAAMAAQVLYFILIGRALGSREYGAFVGVAALIASLSQFSSLGMEMILVRNISRDRTSFSRTWGHALLFAAAGFVALLAVSMLVARFTLRPELRPLVPWIALADGLLGKLVQLTARAFQGAGRLAWTARLTALTYIGRALTAAGLWSFARAHHLRPTAVLWAHLYWIATLAVAIFAMALASLRLGRPRFSAPRRSDVSEGLSFSLSGSSVSLYNDIDKTFLISLGQTHAAGIYSAAYRVVDAASAPIYAVYAAATPRFFREGAQGCRQARAYARRTLLRTLPVALAATLVLAVAAPLFPAAFGPSFRDSVSALRWLCLLPVLRALHYSWGSAITGAASQWNRTAIQLGAAGLNLCLNGLLIPRWSWQGAALASLVTDGALAVASYGVLAHLTRREERAAATALLVCK